MKYLLALVALLCVACSPTTPADKPATQKSATADAAHSATPGPTYAITGGTIHTLGAAGKIENGTVLIKDGRIVAVGSTVDIPADAERIDAAGKIVTPGIFDP